MTEYKILEKRLKGLNIDDKDQEMKYYRELVLMNLESKKLNSKFIHQSIPNKIFNVSKGILFYIKIHLYSRYFNEKEYKLYEISQNIIKNSINN